MTEQQPSIPFGAFHKELDTAATAVGNLLRNQWPMKWPEKGAPTYLQAAVRVGQNTYRTVVFVCSETVECGRQIEFSLSCTPLARTILDGLFGVVYLLDDLPKRIDQFYRGGWREMREELDRHIAKYGSDPLWHGWITQLSTIVDGLKKEVAVTPQDEANLKKSVLYWPTPSQMAKDASLSKDRRAFLEYLWDWHYREMSSDSHLSMPGLARRSVPLLEGKTESLKKYRSDCVMVSAILILATLSEIQLETQWPDIRPRLEYVWTILASVWETSKEIYRMRYEGNL